MKVEQQGKYECMLVAIAALSSRPLAEVREVACIKAGVKEWSEIARIEDTVLPVLLYLMSRFKVRGLPKVPVSLMVPPKDPQRAVSKGQGSMTILEPRGAFAHILLFEDGLLYDPEHADNPVLFDDLSIHYMGWKIVDVTRAW